MARNFRCSVAVTSINVLAATLLPAIGSLALAQWKPTKNVEIVVSSAAGGAPDRTGRLIQRLLTTDAAFPGASVSNRPGGAAIFGSVYINQFPGDGHYMLVMSPTMLGNHIMGTTPINYTHFTPLTVLFREYIVLGVRAESAIRDGVDLAKRMRADAQSASFGIASARGNHNHIVASLFARAAGANPREAKIVVFNSGGQATTAALGGHIDIVVSAPANMAPHLESGKLRILGLSAGKRLHGLYAKVPTFKEQGLPVEFFAWRGLVAPRGLSADQIAYWDTAFARITSTPEWKKEVEQNFWDGQALNSGQTRKHLEREYEMTRAVLNEVGLAK